MTIKFNEKAAAYRWKRIYLENFTAQEILDAMVFDEMVGADKEPGQDEGRRLAFEELKKLGYIAWFPNDCLKKEGPTNENEDS